MVLPEWLKPTGGGEAQPKADVPEPELEDDAAAPEAEAESPETDLASSKLTEEAPPTGSWLTSLQAAEDVSPPVEEGSSSPAAEDPSPPAAEDPSPPAQEDSSPRAGGDEVLDMLAAIERRLKQMGNIQQEHDEQLTSLFDKAKVQAQAQAAETHEIYPDSDDAIDGSEVESTADRAAELAEREAELEQREEDMAESAAMFETLQARILELEEQIAATGDVEPAAEDDANAQVKILSEEIETLRNELRARDEAIADYRTQLERKESTGDEPAAIDGGAAEEMLQRQRRQIERLTEQLAAFNAGDDTEEIRDRDARIAELQEQLEQFQGETPGAKSVARIVAGFGGALRQVRAKASAADPGVAELQEQIEELTAECQRLQDEADLVKAAASGNDQGADGYAAEVAAMRAQIRQLQAERTSRDDDAAPQGKGDAHLKRRIKALEKELQGAGSQKPARPADGPGQAVKIQQQQQDLRKMQQSMQASEQEMIRKWARPRAVIVYGCLLGIALLTAVAAALAANRFFPATVSASVNVQVKTDSGLPIDDEDAAKWLDWNTSHLSTPGFHKTLARRMADQRIDRYADAETIGTRLAADLTVDTPKPGEMIITLAGTDPHELITVLDIVAGSLAAESSRRSGKRNAVAVVRGERRDKTGRISYATLSPTPIRDRRFVAGCVFFVLGLVVSVFLTLRVSRWLLQAKQVANEDEFEITEPVFR